MQYPTDFTSELKRKPICGVLSVAMIAGVPFNKATEVIKKNLMPWQKRHGGRTYHEQRLKSLKTLGVPFREVPTPKMNLGRFVREHAKPNKTYMVETGSHVVTVRNALVADQTEIKPIDQHGCRRYFVMNVTEIGN